MSEDEAKHIIEKILNDLNFRFDSKLKLEVFKEYHRMPSGRFADVIRLVNSLPTSYATFEFSCVGYYADMLDMLINKPMPHPSPCMNFQQFQLKHFYGKSTLEEILVEIDLHCIE